MFHFFNDLWQIIEFYKINTRCLPQRGPKWDQHQLYPSQQSKMEWTPVALSSTILLACMVAAQLSMAYDRILFHRNCHCHGPSDRQMMQWTSSWLNLMNHVMKLVWKTFRFHYLHGQKKTEFKTNNDEIQSEFLKYSLKGTFSSR